MTIQQKIEENAKRGLFSVLRHNRTKEYQIILPIKNGNGQYRASEHAITLEDCFLTLGVYEVQHPENFPEYTYIKSLSFQDIVPIEPYKVGDRVDVSKGANMFKNLQVLHSAVDQAGLLYECAGEDGVSRLFPHDWLTPHFEEETPTVEQEAIELLKKHGYKITKE